VFFWGQKEALFILLCYAEPRLQTVGGRIVRAYYFL